MEVFTKIIAFVAVGLAIWLAVKITKRQAERKNKK